MASDELLYFNGINGATGGYATSPMTTKQLAQVAQGQKPDANDVLALREKKKLVAQEKGEYKVWAVKEGVDPKDLTQTGWGVVFAAADDKKTAALREAIQPLLDHRRAQAAKAKEHFYKEFIGPKLGVQPNEGKREFLARHQMGASGPVDPEKAPYYLLLVGDPETLPYRFQFQLDVQYAVGRIHFDTVEEYHQYAQNVVRFETQARFLAPSAAFWGVATPDDRATKLSAEKLVKPLADSVSADKPDWAVKHLPPEQATKAQLTSLLSGKDMPALLFAATHGLSFPNGDPHQLKHQGALVCQDYPGPKAWKGAVSEDHYFSGDDIASTTNLAGMLAFFFACYGCGTPRQDEFAHLVGERAEIAPYAFLASLPRKMLLQGALAVLGHVERAWGTSFMWGNSASQITVFTSTLKRLMEDHPVGSATEYFNGRYAEMSSELTDYIQQYDFNPEDMDQEKVADLWTANNDARGYIVIGDPAVRMPVRASGAAAGAKPTLMPVVSSSPKPETPEGEGAIAAHLTQAIKSALTTTPGLQNVSDVKVEVKDLTVTGGTLSTTVTVNAKAQRQ